jgi:hypothetical protein
MPTTKNVFRLTGEPVRSHCVEPAVELCLVPIALALMPANDCLPRKADDRAAVVTDAKLVQGITYRLML